MARIYQKLKCPLHLTCIFLNDLESRHSDVVRNKQASPILKSLSFEIHLDAQRIVSSAPLLTESDIDETLWPFKSCLHTDI